MSKMEHDVMWRPDAESVAGTRIVAFMEWLRLHRNLKFTSYDDLWRWSVTDVDEFWEAVREFFGVRFDPPAREVLSTTSMPGAVWFDGAELNFAGYLLNQAHDGPALIALHELGEPETWSWDRLRDEVAGFASWLLAQGIQPGDRVVAYLPNIPQAVVAFLAAASVGAVFAICGPEFAVPTVVARFGPLKPDILIATTRYTFGNRRHDRTQEVQRLRAELPSLRGIVVVDADRHVSDATSWTAAVATPGGGSAASVSFNHPLWVLFSSGTTGTPKGFVHGHGGVLLENLKFHNMHLDLRADDTFFWYTSTSWMVWTTVVSGLLVGATAVLYDGSATHPGTDRLWQIVEDQRVTVFGSSASYLQASVKANLEPRIDHDITALRALHSSGSPLGSQVFQWAHQHVGAHIPLFSSSGGTDVATAFLAGNPLLPVRSGEIPGPCLGVNVQSWNEHGQPVTGEVGELVVAAPMPSMPLHFWNDPDDERYRASYFETFPDVWRHGDWVEFTENGGAVIHGRSDATLNRLGVRIGTSEIYQAVEGLEEVVESLAIGVEAPDGAYWLPLFVVLRQGVTLDEKLTARINDAIRRTASPRHVPDDIIAVPGIPHTLTGKKLEVPVKRILLGMDPGVDRGAVDSPELLTIFGGLRRNKTARPG